MLDEEQIGVMWTATCSEGSLRIEINPARDPAHQYHHICGVSVPMSGMRDAAMNKAPGLPPRGSGLVAGTDI